jgi:hypothetical protein
MAVLTTGNTFANGDQVTAGSLNNAVNDAEFAAGAVDGISTQKSGSGAIIVKDLGISRGKIAIDAVGTDQLANDVVISTSGSITGAAGSFTTLSASGDISVDGSVKQSGNTGNLILKGGDTDGANIELYGASSSEANKAFYDASTHSFRPEDGSSNRVVISSSGLTASGDLTVDTTTLKVDSTNNRVGIGTTTPQHKLDIRAESDAAISTGLLIANTASSSEGTGTAIRMVHSTSQTSNSASTISSERAASNGSIIGLNLSTDGSAVPSRVMTLLGANGNVGIGTASPEAILQTSTSENMVASFKSTDPTAYVQIIDSVDATYIGSQSGIGFIGGSADVSSNNININLSNGNIGIGTTSPSHKLDVNSGAINQVALFESTDETAYIELADSTGSVQFITYSSGALRIATGGAGAGSVGTSALFIDQSQNVGIGDDTPSFKLDVNGTGRFVGDLTLDDEVLHNISGTQARQPGYYAGTYGLEIEQTAQGSTIHIGRSNGNCMNVGADATAAGTDVNVVYFRDTGAGSPVANEVGKIIIDTTSTNYETSSDYRLKENEVDITDGIDRLKELKPYRFNFTRNPSKVVDGFFAHEVSPVVPESISGEKDQVDDEGNPVYQGIDQSKLVPLLTAALQEAVAKIEALEARVQTLEG